MENREQNRVTVSFCIPVYNQKELVERCISSIVKYKGQDIEIIISDDHSTQDIKNVVDLFSDKRIVYRKNEENVGHDRNILKSLSMACGKYAFLLRTRDMILPESIPYLISVLRNSEASYLTGSALDQEQKIRIQCDDKIIEQGKKTVDAHFSLFIHPSGNIYKMSDLNICLLYEFLDRNSVTRIGFIVHNLIRLFLAQKGNFQLINKPIWIYTDTLKEKDRAVNRDHNHKNVYDPEYNMERYKFELMWIELIFERELLYHAYLKLTELYLDLSTWGFLLSNNDKRAQYHYGFEKINVSLKNIRSDFYNICCTYDIDKLSVDPQTYKRDIRKIFWKNKYAGVFRYVAMKITNGKRIYRYLSIIYRRIIKKV